MPASGKKASASKRVVKEKKVKKDGEKKRKKAKFTSYSRWIHKLAPKVPTADGKKKNASITTKGMAILNSFVLDLFDRIASDSGRVLQYTGKQTLRVKGVEYGAKQQLPKELFDHAHKAGTAAVANFSKTSSK